MITLTGSVDVSAGVAANLASAMAGAGRSAASLSSGEKVSAAATPSGGVAPAPGGESLATENRPVGRMLDATA